MSWVQSTLGEVADIFSGYAFKSADMNSEGGTPLIKIKNIADSAVSHECDAFLNEDFDLTKYERFHLLRDDFLVAMTGQGSVGRIGKMRGYKPGFYVNQRVAIVRVNSEKANPIFIFYQIATHSNEVELFNKANGAGQPNISAKQIGELPAVLPPVEKQQHIADVLSAYDDLIENNQKQIKLLEEAAQRLYKEWFVDLRFPGHETTPITDGIPEGWKEGIIQDVVVYHDKKRKPLSGMQRAEMQGQYRYYGAASILDYVNDYLFDGTYLLLGEDGTVVTEDGFPILQYVTGKFWVNNHAHVLTGQPDYPTEYLYMMFKATKVKDVVTGAAQPKISQARLSNKKMIIPCKELVRAYCDQVNPIFKQILNLEQQIILHKEARDRLLPKLMNGEIEV